MDLLAPTFDVVRGRAAYVVAEVDDAVATTRRLLAGQPVLDRPGRGFTLTREEGYDAGQVDAWAAAVRRELQRRASSDDAARHDDPEDPPELRGVDHGWDAGHTDPQADGPAYRSSFPLWVRLTALLLAVAVALFFVASYFV